MNKTFNFVIEIPEPKANRKNTAARKAIATKNSKKASSISIPSSRRAIVSKARRTLGLTQDEMGLELGGFSRSAVSDWERGTRRVPLNVVAIAKSILTA